MKINQEKKLKEKGWEFNQKIDLIEPLFFVFGSTSGEDCQLYNQTMALTLLSE